MQQRLCPSLTPLPYSPQAPHHTMPACGHVGGATASAWVSSSWLLTTRTTATSCLFLHRGIITTPRRKPTLLPLPQTHRTSRRTFLSQAGGDWEESWRRGTTPWDTTGAAPSLVNLLQRPSSPLLPPIPGVSRALVPGAGSGYECMLLAEAGWDVLGLDLAPTAIARAESLWKERQAEEEGGGKGWLTYKVGNFYELEGRFDLIFDYTFLCALPPVHRPRWAEKMRELLMPKTGQLVTLIFPVHDSSKSLQCLNLTDGPPFEVTPGLYRHLLLGGEEEGGREGGREGGFTCLELTGPLKDSIKPRKGKEWLGRWEVREMEEEEEKKKG